MVKKRVGGRSLIANSKSLLLAFLVVTAALAVYGVASAVVSHPPSDIDPQGAGSGLEADNSAKLGGLSSADILAQITAQSGGGGALKVYTNEGGFAGYFLGVVEGQVASACDNWYLGSPNGVVKLQGSLSGTNCARSSALVYFLSATCSGNAYSPAGDYFANGGQIFKSVGISEPEQSFSAAYMRSVAGVCDTQVRSISGVRRAEPMDASVCGNGPCKFMP